MPFYDVMVDLETTGTNPDENWIIQLSAVKFNIKTREIEQSTFFDRCLKMSLPKRFWDEDTRQWWLGKNRDVYQTLVPRMEDPKVVFEDFTRWVCENSDSDEPRRFWSKPSCFDYPFLQSYYKQLGLSSPFHYRYSMDVNTYIRGLANDPLAELEYIPMTGPKHNALFDNIHQIGNLFAAIEAHRGQAQ